MLNEKQLIACCVCVCVCMLWECVETRLARQIQWGDHLALCEFVSVQSAKGQCSSGLLLGSCYVSCSIWTCSAWSWGGSALHNAALFFLLYFYWTLALSRCFCPANTQIHAIMHTHWRALSTQLGRQGSVTGCSQLSTSVQPLFFETHTYAHTHTFAHTHTGWLC